MSPGNNPAIDLYEGDNMIFHKVNIIRKEESCFRMHLFDIGYCLEEIIISNTSIILVIAVSKISSANMNRAFVLAWESGIKSIANSGCMPSRKQSFK